MIGYCEQFKDGAIWTFEGPITLQLLSTLETLAGSTFVPSAGIASLPGGGTRQSPLRDHERV